MARVNKVWVFVVSGSHCIFLLFFINDWRQWWRIRKINFSLPVPVYIWDLCIECWKKIMKKTWFSIKKGWYRNFPERKFYTGFNYYCTNKNNCKKFLLISPFSLANQCGRISIQNLNTFYSFSLPKFPFMTLANDF